MSITVTKQQSGSEARDAGALGAFWGPGSPSMMTLQGSHLKTPQPLVGQWHEKTARKEFSSFHL